MRKREIEKQRNRETEKQKKKETEIIQSFEVLLGLVTCIDAQCLGGLG
jgi:hypothetical protein